MADEKNELPIHRTRRVSLTKTQLRTEIGAELLSLCQSVTADGKVNADEVAAMRQWLVDSHHGDLPGATYLREVVERVISDGQITPAEMLEVYRAVESVLPPDLRRVAHGARRDVERDERAARDNERGHAQEERQKNRSIASANFMVAGVRHENRPQIIAAYVEAGMPAWLVRDRENRYSRNAIAVLIKTGHQIGFVPEVDAIELAPLLDGGAKCEAYVSKVLTGGRSPIPVVQVRLYGSDATMITQPPPTYFPNDAHQAQDLVPDAPALRVPPVRPRMRVTIAVVVLLALAAIIVFVMSR